MVFLPADYKDEILKLYSMVEPLAGLVGTLRWASYPTLTEAVVTLAMIKKGLLNLQGPLTFIEPFNMNSGTRRYACYELAHESLSSTLGETRRKLPEALNSRFYGNHANPYGQASYLTWRRTSPMLQEAGLSESDYDSENSTAVKD